MQLWDVKGQHSWGPWQEGLNIKPFEQALANCFGVRKDLHEYIVGRKNARKQISLRTKTQKNSFLMEQEKNIP